MAVVTLSTLSPGDSPPAGEGNKPQELPCTQSHCCWIYSAHSCFRFRKATCPSLRQEYCSRTIKVGPVHESIPTVGFGKRLDLHFSFRVVHLFDWPVPLYLILKNDEER